MRDFKGRVVRVEPHKLKEGKAIIKLSFELPEGYEFNEKSPMHVTVRSKGETLLQVGASSNELDKGLRSWPFDIPLQTALGTQDLILDAVIYYCREESKVCLFENIRVEVPVQVDRYGPEGLYLSVKVRPKA